jgi:hypothetical protein
VSGELAVPDLDPDVDTLTAALAYVEGGWYVGRVRRGSKNPGSRLGERWPTGTSRDPKTIIGWFIGTDDGVFLHRGRSGAVVLDVDNPDQSPDFLTEAFTAAPAPCQSTRGLPAESP